MLGMSRTVKGDAMVAFEYLRIVERADGVFYVAHPNARTPGTDFRLTSLTHDTCRVREPAARFSQANCVREEGRAGAVGRRRRRGGHTRRDVRLRTDALNAHELWCRKLAAETNVRGRQGRSAPCGGVTWDWWHEPPWRRCPPDRRSTPSSRLRTPSERTDTRVKMSDA